MTMRRPAAGFTLIEVMVVVLIVGILATFATLSISGRNVDDTLESEARRLEILLGMALEEAEIKGLELGLRSTEGGYEFLSLGTDGRWQPYAEQGPFRPRAVPEPLLAVLFVEDRRVKPAKPAIGSQGEDTGAEKPFFDNVADRKVEPVEPHVLLLSSGEVTAFDYDFTLPGHPAAYRVSADAAGQLSRSRIQDDRPRQPGAEARR